MDVYFHGKLITPNVGIKVTPGVTDYLDIKVYDIDYSILKPTVTNMTRTIELLCVDGVTAQIQLPTPSSNISSAGGSTLFSTNPSAQYKVKKPFAAPFHPTSEFIEYRVNFTATTHTGSIQLNDKGPSSLAEVRVNIPVNYDASTQTHGVDIPEFPIVAVPVAGIIGLLFVFGRKKGDM